MSSVFGRNSMQHHGVSAGLLSDMGPGMHPRVSILGGNFRLIDEAGQGYGAPVILRNTTQGQKLSMLAIIIGTNPKRSRIFYERAYDPVNPGPPDCFSDNGVAPSVQASNPQARTCAECDWSKWGSDISALTGKKIKACSEKRKIALLVVGDTTNRVYEAQIPPATLKNMAKYAAMVAANSPPGEQRKADVCDMVTAISFVPGQTGVLEFEPFAWISSTYLDDADTLRVAVDAQMNPLPAPDGGESTGEWIDEIWGGDSMPLLLGLNDQPWTPPASATSLGGMRGLTAPLEYGATPSTTAAAPAAQGAVAGQGGLAPNSPFAPPEGRQPVQATSPFVAPAVNPPPAPAGAPQQQVTKRGRKPKTVEPAAGVAGAQAATGTQVAPFQRGAGAGAAVADGGDIPGFLRRAGVPDNGAATAGGPVNVASGPALQPGSGPGVNSGAAGSPPFGMVDAGPPPTDLAKTLGGVFALPVAGR